MNDATAGAARDHEAQALAALRWNWDEAYDIGYDEANGWHARRRDGIGGLLAAATPEDLRAEILADHGLNPVPREFAPARDADPAPVPWP